jgi:hypothetical protein
MHVAALSGAASVTQLADLLGALTLIFPHPGVTRSVRLSPSAHAAGVEVILKAANRFSIHPPQLFWSVAPFPR